MITAREIAKIAIGERKAKQTKALSIKEQVDKIYERTDLTPRERSVLVSQISSVGKPVLIRFEGKNVWTRQPSEN